MTTEIDPLEVALSADEVCEDLACSLIHALLSTGALRASDSFFGYSAKIKIELKLRDIDVTEVRKEILVGDQDDPSESRTCNAEINIDESSPGSVRSRNGSSAPSLERGSEPQRRKFYTPRQVVKTIPTN